MSAWSDASKVVGWDKRRVKIPPPEEASRLVERGKKRDFGALCRMLEINRFAASPTTEEASVALNIIVEGLFRDVRPLFDEAPSPKDPGEAY